MANEIFKIRIEVYDQVRNRQGGSSDRALCVKIKYFFTRRAGCRDDWGSKKI
jgi:hypothetical protein